jgi:hypothetical protein
MHPELLLENHTEKLCHSYSYNVRSDLTEVGREMLRRYQLVLGRSAALKTVKFSWVTQKVVNFTAK